MRMFIFEVLAIFLGVYILGAALLFLTNDCETLNIIVFVMIITLLVWLSFILFCRGAQIVLMHYLQGAYSRGFL